MRIGSYEFDKPVCSAPMAGVSDKAYRLLAQEMGCNLTWTEMISATALTYNNSKTLQILDVSGEKDPVVVQLFGSDPSVISEAAKIAEGKGATIIDLNMGCPAPKIVKNNEGSALLKNLPLAGKIASAVVDAVKVPVVVKFRLGWDSTRLVGDELAKILEAAGVAAITVHARTKEQMYAGKADWEKLALIKSEVKIPVIGNGDIWNPEDAKKMLEVTGCDGVMIGRGSLGNPWIFKRTIHFLQRGEMLPPPTAIEKITFAKRHLGLLTEIKGEKIAVQEMRKHVAWYIKGLQDSARTRDMVMGAKNSSEMLAILENYAENLMDYKCINENTKTYDISIQKVDYI